MAVTVTAKQVKSGDVIKAEDHNALVTDVEELAKTAAKGDKGEKGDKGDTGAAGKGVKSLALKTTDGKVTGGTVTFTDDSTAAVTIAEG